MRHLLLFLLLLPLFSLAQSSQPSAENKDHKLNWKLPADGSFAFVSTLPKGTLLLARYKEEHGGSYPTISITTDALPPSVTSARAYAEQNLALLPQFGITLDEKHERTFSNLPAVEASLYTADGKLSLQQIYLVRGSNGYVITTTCPLPLLKRLQKILGTTRDAITFREQP